MALLTKEQISDKGRYQFGSKEVDLPEIGGSVKVKTLSVAERDALPDLVDADGKPVATVAKLAKTFAAVVSEPKLTIAEAEAFLGDLPATAFDAVMEKFGELLGARGEDRAASLREFQPSED